MTVDKKDIYCTSFCNQAHHKKTGHPVNHECYILNPKALALEIAGKVDEAILIGIRSERILNPKARQVV